MENISINYFGYFTPFGGYGIANLNWITYLSRAGIDVYPHKKFSYVAGTPEHAAFTKEQIDLLDKPYVTQKIGIIETTPFDFGIIDTEVKIANTMCESSKIGRDWVNACNRMDIVTVPNEFQKKVFFDSGVNVPIKVVRHGTWTEMFPYYERPEREVFTFGTVGFLNDRKGVFDVIQAFVSEFSPEEKVRLVLKSSNKDFGYYSHFRDPRIETDIRHISPQELNEIYRSFDCFVFPSRAEGVGQPPREAMSTGLPVILTNYSGLEEVSSLGYPLNDFKLVEGINPQRLEQPGEWAIPNIQEIMYYMRYVFEHRDEARQKGREASRIIKEEHSWEKSAEQMIAVLKEFT